MTTQLYYFSGTGNSLHVARELKRRIPETTLVPVVSALRTGRLQSDADTVGIVFPIHAFNLPLLVKRFLEQVDLGSASYLFAVTTRLCSHKTFSDIDRLLAKQNRSLDASFCVEMPCTYIPIFKIPSQEEITEMEVAVQRDLDAIQAAVINRRTSLAKDDALVYLLGHLLYPPITAWYRKVRFPDMARSFYVSSECAGCGTCERVCLSGKVQLVDGKPAWSDAVECTYCFACLHFCPAQAVQMKNRKTTQRARYHHPEITAWDVAGQKDWGQS